MKKNRTSLAVFGGVLLVVAGGIVALAAANLAPPSQTVEKPIPDDSIPH